MLRTKKIGIALLTGAVAGAVLLAPTGPAAAAPGDWTQLSQTSSANRYPEISNITEPTMARFGDTLQVLWSQHQSSSKEAYFTAILNGGGQVTTPAQQAFPEWDGLTKNPTLMSLGGQRFLSFSGLNPGRTGAQYFATSPDGLAWTVSNGSMSETQVAYAGYGSDAIDNAGTPVWVGNAGSTSGIRWHVGTSDANPAPAGSDQKFDLSGCCAYNAAAARDQATGTVWASFYSNSSATSENGIQVGQIIPAGAWAQAPGSTQIQDGAASSSDPDQTVAMAARAGGGVYVAYKLGYPSPKAIRLLRVDTGATLDVPVSGNVRSVSMGADPAGRIWLSWIQGDRIRAVHTNRAGTALGAIGLWGAPARTSNLWKTATSGSAAGADVVVTATTSSAINAWHTQVLRTLSIQGAPASVRRGTKVVFTVTDAGDPVSGATVKFAGQTATTNASGRAEVQSSGHGRKTATAKKSGYNAGATSIKVR